MGFMNEPLLKPKMKHSPSPPSIPFPTTPKKKEESAVIYSHSKIRDGSPSPPRLDLARFLHYNKLINNKQIPDKILKIATKAIGKIGSREDG